MKEFVVNKLYAMGRLNEERKSELLSEFDDEREVMRIFILKVLQVFLKQLYW